MAYKFYIILICLLLFACDFSSKPDDFYSYSKDLDLWRVPLIKPHEVVSPTNNSSEDWFLVLKDHQIQGPKSFQSTDRFSFSSIQTIGILDSVIVATNQNEYWPKLSGQYPSTLIIDVKTGQQFLYANQQHKATINQKLKALKISEIKLLDWKTIKDTFLKDLTLPKDWAK